MSNKVLSYYKIYCDTELQYNYIWSESIPTTCPNNNSHSIDETKTIIVDKIDTNIITVTEPTEGYFKCGSIEQTILSGNIGDVTVFERSWPFDIMIWLVDLYVTANMVGDMISIVAKPPQIINGIGYLTQSASIGDTVLYVSQTVLDNMVHGFHIKVGSVEVGRCDEIDKQNGCIILSPPLQVDVNQYSVFYPVIYMVHNFKLHIPCIIDFAKKGFKGKPVPKNTAFEIRYTNNSTEQKEVCLRNEYYYGF